MGASREGYDVEQIVRLPASGASISGKPNSGGELDLLVMRGGRRYGVEVKHGDAPSITKSTRIAIQDLGLDRLFMVYPGDKAYGLD